jgi:hypothetical protein
MNAFNIFHAILALPVEEPRRRLSEPGAQTQVLWGLLCAQLSDEAISAIGAKSSTILKE